MINEVILYDSWLLVYCKACLTHLNTRKLRYVRKIRNYEALRFVDFWRVFSDLRTWPRTIETFPFREHGHTPCLLRVAKLEEIFSDIFHTFHCFLNLTKITSVIRIYWVMVNLDFLQRHQTISQQWLILSFLDRWTYSCWPNSCCCWLWWAISPQTGTECFSKDGRGYEKPSEIRCWFTRRFKILSRWIWVKNEQTRSIFNIRS